MNPFRNLALAGLLAGTAGPALLAAAAPAQEPSTPAPTPTDAQTAAPNARGKGKGEALLAQALEATANAGSLAFRTESKTPPPFRGAGMAEQILEVEGLCVPGLQTARVGDHEVVFAGPLMIAREDDEPWKLRQGHLANGAQLPFVLRPDLLLHALRCLELPVVHNEVGTDENMPVEIVTVTLEDEAAWNLVYAGALPRPGSGLQGMVVRMAVGVAGGGGGPVAPDEPEMKLDLAFVIDPPSKLLRAIRCRAYTKAAAGGVMIMAGPGGAIAPAGDDGEEGEEPAAGAGNELKFKDGLPLRRKKKDEAVTRFEIRFTDHGKVPAPQLDEAAKKLLGVR